VEAVDVHPVDGRRRKDEVAERLRAHVALRLGGRGGRGAKRLEVEGEVVDRDRALARVVLQHARQEGLREEEPG
jgi:hypothetical protein